jgi:hypothetical protein
MNRRKQRWGHAGGLRRPLDRNFVAWTKGQRAAVNLTVTMIDGSFPGRVPPAAQSKWPIALRSRWSLGIGGDPNRKRPTQTTTFFRQIPSEGRESVLAFMRISRKHTRSRRLLVNRRSSAFALGISVGSVDCLISEGRLPSRPVRGNGLIPATALQTFADAENRRLRSRT